MLSIESPESLSSWLTKELSPICDADPGALAKYVLALLKKPLSGDEIKDVCLQQLEVFLQSHTKRFVEKLFTALSERSYMEAPADPPTSIVSTSTVAAVEEKKERKDEKKEKEKKKDVPKEKSEERKEKSKEKEPSPPHSSSASASQSSISNDRSRRVPPSSTSSSNQKRDGGRGEGGSTSDSAAPSTSSTRRSPVRAPRKRVSPPPQLSRRRSRSPPVRGNRRVGGVRRSPIREKRRSRSRSRSPVDKERRRERGERDEDQPRRKKRCRDFDEQGVCLRGEACPYDHGLDPVVVENAALAAMGLKTAAAVATSSYSVPPPGYNPISTNPPPPGVENVGYNPEAPGMGMGDFSVPPPPIPVVGGWRQPNPYGIPQQVGYEPSGSIPVDPHNGGMMGGMGGVMRGRGRGRGRGGYHPYGRGGHAVGGGGGDIQKEETLAAPVAARTLIVKKIPAELNNISKLNEHFEQFGSITNMQVHYERQPDTALITFSSRFEATKAYKNPEPIFNNRFIRVFWYSNIMEGGPNKTTLSSGVTVETPGGEPQMAPPPVVPREPVILPGPGQTKYRKPEAVEAFKKKQEEAAVRKADKEAVLRQKDLLRRTTRILSSLQDQQKQVIMAMMKETEAEKKKTLNKMYKQLEGKIASQKGDVEEQQEKLKGFEAKVTKNETEGGADGGSSGDEGHLSPDEGANKGDDDNEDDLLSAQVDEEFAALKQEQLVE